MTLEDRSAKDRSNTIAMKSLVVSDIPLKYCKCNMLSNDVSTTRVPLCHFAMSHSFGDSDVFGSPHFRHYQNQL